jgi:hypothetical protein
VSAALVWEDPPPRIDHDALAAELRAHPGRWARIDKTYSPESARVIAYQIRAARLAAYAPRGDFEAARRKQGPGESYVYVRYLGDGASDE